MKKKNLMSRGIPFYNLLYICTPIDYYFIYQMRKDIQRTQKDYLALSFFLNVLNQHIDKTIKSLTDDRSNFIGRSLVPREMFIFF